MIKAKGFLWQSQLPKGIRQLFPFTPHSQILGLELNEDLALALGDKGTACYLGESALTCLNTACLCKTWRALMEEKKCWRWWSWWWCSWKKKTVIVSVTYKYKHKAATDILLVIANHHLEAGNLPKSTPLRYSPCELNTPSFKMKRCTPPFAARPRTLPVPSWGDCTARSRELGPES